MILDLLGIWITEIALSWSLLLALLFTCLLRFLTINNIQTSRISGQWDWSTMRCYMASLLGLPIMSYNSSTTSILNLSHLTHLFLRYLKISSENVWREKSRREWAGRKHFLILFWMRVLVLEAGSESKNKTGRLDRSLWIWSRDRTTAQNLNLSLPRKLLTSTERPPACAKLSKILS